MFGVKWNKKPKTINIEMLNFNGAVLLSPFTVLMSPAIIHFSINLSLKSSDASNSGYLSCIVAIGDLAAKRYCRPNQRHTGAHCSRKMQGQKREWKRALESLVVNENRSNEIIRIEMRAQKARFSFFVVGVAIAVAIHSVIWCSQMVLAC